MKSYKFVLGALSILHITISHSLRSLCLRLGLRDRINLLQRVYRSNGDDASNDVHSVHLYSVAMVRCYFSID